VNWQVNTRLVLQKFYHVGKDIDAAQAELNQLMQRIGNWGDIINHKQSLLNILEDELANFNNDVQKVIYKQKNMTSTVSFWQTTGFQQYPLLAPIATRLAVVAIQSADVERVCKAHKVIHTRARNSLKNKTVNMLLFTYVNLRLLNKCTEEMGDFLMQAVESCVQEGEAAGSIVTEAEMDLEAELCMAGEVIEISDVLVHERAAETLVFGDENETPLSMGF
jgi:hypothetical protein